MAEDFISLNVEGMSCEHCVESIKSAVGNLNGVSAVTLSLADKKVAVEYDKERVTLDTIKSVIEDQGYEVK